MYLASARASIVVASSYLPDFSLLATWPLNVRVGENSPSLWPTMFSVMYTGMNFLPLCTAIVCPTISGTMVERRDHVLTTFFSNRRLCSLTFFIRWSSVNGPFFNDLPIPRLDPSFSVHESSLFSRDIPAEPPYRSLPASNLRISLVPSPFHDEAVSLFIVAGLVTS